MLHAGTERELALPGRTRTRVLVSYNVLEAAAALGRSESAFRRWLTREVIPAPVLIDQVRLNGCYSMEELEIIAEELREHERHFANLCESHHETIIRISQRIHGLRDVEYAIQHRRGAT